MSTLVQQGKTVAAASQTGSPRTLRCIAYQQKSRLFVAECIDLNLMVKAKSIHQATESLNEAIGGYLAVACAGDMTGLVPRPSPLNRRLLYHWAGIRALFSRLIHKSPNRTATRRFDYTDCRAAS